VGHGKFDGSLVETQADRWVGVGSRRSGDFGKLAGKGGVVGAAVQEVQDALSENKSARIVVSTAVDVLAASNPAIGTIVAAYKISRTMYDIASKAQDAYAKTHDANKAVAAAAGEVVNVAAGTVRDQAVSRLVDVGWTTMKSSAGIETTELQDRILSSAAKNTLAEVLPK